MHRLIGTLLLLAVALPSAASAVDRTILGKKIVIKDPTGAENKRVVVGLARETETDIPALTDPTVNGGTLEVISLGGANSTYQGFSLPASGWSATGTGFKYTGSAAGEPVRKIILKRSPGGIALMQVLVKGTVGTDPVEVVPPHGATRVGLVLTVFSGGDRYCTTLGLSEGGTYIKDDPQQLKIVGADSEPGCQTPITTTTSSSTTSTLP